MASTTQTTTAALQIEGSQTVLMLDGNYRIKVVEDMAEFMNLKEAWDGLLSDKKTHVPFLCHDWFRIWLKHFLQGDKLFILLLYMGEQLVAIGPFIIRHEKYKGLLNVKKIEFIGNVHSPIKDFICVDNNEANSENYLFQIFSFFSKHYKAWDIIELDYMREEGTTFKNLERMINMIGLKYRLFVCAGNWYVDGIDYTFDEYFKNIPKNLRRNIKRYCKSLETLGRITFEMKTERGKLELFLDCYDEIRSKSWKALEKGKRFNKEFLELAAERGYLRLAVLFCENSPIAAAKYVVWKKGGLGLDAVFDEKYSKYSPGVILTSLIFRYLIDTDKINFIDLGRGDESYKKEWATGRKELKGIAVFNRTLKGQTLGFLMTKALPHIQEQPFLMTAKRKIATYLKQRE